MRLKLSEVEATALALVDVVEESEEKLSEAEADVDEASDELSELANEMEPLELVEDASNPAESAILELAEPSSDEAVESLAFEAAPAEIEPELEAEESRATVPAIASEARKTT
ncbi:hypothetical protein BBJ28_00002013 [Nothophytophthora sp. Chile5]|nr:hypothetical protein BBJ28_00002013 [Nothophytophthora sp. Chile5]